MASNDEKTEGQKSRWTLPLRLYFIQVDVHDLTLHSYKISYIYNCIISSRQNKLSWYFISLKKYIL